ncbi:MAG TPA: hypothetical protein VK196_07510 [Magnetospirillum sp.]|nr:hypothetical protein [Magnetospirillum sp.]
MAYEKKPIEGCPPAEKIAIFRHIDIAPPTPTALCATTFPAILDRLLAYGKKIL